MIVDSESEESDESGSDSDSESRDSGSDTNADGAPKTEVCNNFLSLFSLPICEI